MVETSVGLSAIPQDISSVDATAALAQPPLNLAAIFGNRRPVELEIGCGKGRFLSLSAVAQPLTNWLGIERQRKFFHRTAQTVITAGVGGHVRLLHADAMAVVTHFLPPGCLAGVHIYHPDPWPKTRHARRRIMRPQALTALAEVVEIGGRLLFQTDVRWYWQQACDALAATGGMWRITAAVEVANLSSHGSGLTTAGLPQNLPPDAGQRSSATDQTAGTHWEVKSRRAGCATYRIQAIRTPPGHDRQARPGHEVTGETTTDPALAIDPGGIAAEASP